MSQGHHRPPLLNQSQEGNLSIGGEKPRTQTSPDNQNIAQWAAASSTSSSSHPTPESQMFGAPPMFYDPAQAAQEHDQRGMSDYNAWAQNFAQGGQYANAAATGYAQAPQLNYGHQQQPMQDVSVTMTKATASIRISSHTCQQRPTTHLTKCIRNKHP
ncbi:uncharacterized protein B0H18DRAFT_1213313 [Fomitopsis serialis]|uniref:uncharacterized protein n=1 Tax=Fomitopsis serialis TaxID=139415 RepID=UPI002008751E|nr:uncharacterized protein B0H18DRAFT_1213313 [Neoantrodia serialis]KAH9920618.1 hypothetical protein B0H18DRAFT_1213313 [Neoantrodia serialis]